MLFLFIQRIYSEKVLRKQLWVLWLAIGFAGMIAMLGYLVWPNVWAGLLWSASIEIVGSVLFFAVVDAVIDALKENNQQNRNCQNTNA